MPWWAITYLGSVVILATAGCLDECSRVISSKAFNKKWIFNFATSFVEDIVPCYFFLSFWFPKLKDILGILSPILVLTAIAWQIYSWPKAAREFDEEETRLNHWQRKNILLVLAMYQSPLYVVSVIAVLRNYFH